MPEQRNRMYDLLVVGDRIVIIGGDFFWNDGVQERRLADGFWFHRNEYDLRCRCCYCEEAGLAGACPAVLEEDCEEAIREFGDLILLHPQWDDFEIQLNDPPLLRGEEGYSIPLEFHYWQKRKDPLSSCQYYDIKILDLKPTLQTLALVSIADAKELDLSNLHHGLHVNLNTMYVFSAKAAKMRVPSEEERDMLVHGKVEFRKNQVRALKEQGAYDWGIVRRLMQMKVDARFDVDKV